ncbi:MAG: phosphatase PAP2 family protein [Chloroflexota bacterium]
MIWLQIIYPILMILWLVFSLKLNAWASTQPYHHSTRIWLDDRVPFISSFAFIYFSAYVLGNIGYFILFFDQAFYRVFLGQASLFVAAMACYRLFPCRVNRNETLEVKDLSTRLIALFQSQSKPYNSFPSMHVGFSVFHALIVLRYGGINLGIALLIWAGLVAVSTLLTKQHHLIDVFAGGGLALLIFWGIQL